MRKFVRPQVLAAGLLAFAAQEARATFDYPPGTPSPVAPMPGAGIPSVTQVPGKEYAYYSTNVTVAGAAPYVADPGQSQVFNGVGGDADGIDFAPMPVVFNLDAMASFRDTLFLEVISNDAALLLSFTGDVADSSEIPIHYEATSGATGTWATWAEVDGEGAAFGAPPGPMPGEFEGLEVWGPDGPGGADTSRISAFDADSGTSVFSWDGTSLFAAISQGAMFGALSAFTGYDGTFSEIDVDALMNFDVGVGPDDFSFGTGDLILFSVRPTTSATAGLNFDGGEIFVGEGTGGGSLTILGYLFHGGHLWDTAFDVAGTFGGLENVDGLEAVAVPEPGALLLGGTALLGLAAFRRRRSR